MVDLLDSTSPLLDLFKGDAVERQDFCYRVVGAVKEFRGAGGDPEGYFILDDFLQGTDLEILG